MKPIIQALRLFSRERGLWKYALKPLLWGALAYVIVVLATAGLGERIGEAVSGSPIGGLVGGVVGLIVTVVFGGAIYLALVGLISGFGFDALSREVEERQFGRSVGQPLSFAAGIGDGIARLILATVLGLVGLCGAGTVVIPWLVAALLVLMDATAPSLLRRGVSFGRQFGAARRLPGAWPFAFVSGVIVLVPVLNVLALPILVAAGTILVAEGGERA